MLPLGEGFVGLGLSDDSKGFFYTGWGGDSRGFGVGNESTQQCGLWREQIIMRRTNFTLEQQRMCRKLAAK